MKKFVAAFLCCLMVFRVAAVPTLAADLTEHDHLEEYTPFAYNWQGDTIVFTDAEGHIIEVKPSDATTYNAAAGALLIQSSGGAMGAGAASILAPALTILGYILAAGVVIYSVVGLAECVMDMYYLLSDAARAELDAIAESGADNFSLADNPNLAAELPTIYGETFFTDDGTFINSGITFDPSNMLEYDWNAQYVYGNDLTSSIYKYALGSSAVAIAGTSLSVALVDSPFTGWTGAPDDVTKAFQVTNSVTGATLTFMPDYTTEWLTKSCCTYKISAPVVTTHGTENVYYTLGFWVLAECGLLAAGEDCSDCYYRYHSDYYGESDSLTSSGYYLFTGTGITGLDDVIFDGQWLNTVSVPNTWDLERAVSMDGVDSHSLPKSAVTTIASDLTYAMTLTDTANPPAEEDKIYLPPAGALTDANTLTQTGAQTGTWEETVTADPSIPGTDTGSLWDTLYQWLYDILSAILSVLEWVLGFFEACAEMIKSVVLSLFIPSEGFLEQFIADITALVQDRMGILTYPLSLLYDFFDHLLEVGEAEPVFTWGSWSYKGTEFIPAGSFNFNDILENDTFKTVHDIYLLLVDVGIVWGLVNLLRKKYDSIIAN